MGGGGVDEPRTGIIYIYNNNNNQGSFVEPPWPKPVCLGSMLELEPQRRHALKVRAVGLAGRI